MQSSLKWRIGVTLVVMLLAVVYILPTFTADEAEESSLLPSNKINLGLDLKGGIHLTLGVEVQKALETQVAQTGDDLRAQARDEGLVVLKPKVGEDGASLTFVMPKAEHREGIEELLEDYENAYMVASTEELATGGIRYGLKMKPEYREHLAKLTMDQAIKTIRNRIDQFGVAEPDIRRQQDNRIQVQLPGLEDPQRAIEVLGKTAHLEFKLVRDDVDLAKAQQGILPPGVELSFIERTLLDGTTSKTPMVTDESALLTGEYITNANVAFDSFNQPYVMMSFNSRGARLFEHLTGEHTGDRLAIILDGTVYSAPSIQEKIAGGRASITGSFSLEEAQDLAIVLRAGALPAPVVVLEERSVGPSLGQESIDAGIQAALIGFGLVVVFMVIYYGFAGVVADLVLVLNILLVMAGLAAFGATLTLPGIAGIILTLGMAVDANVLIYERIREEVRRGQTPRASIDEGYARATLTILDANVTTLIAAVILYQFGTGPIRGFAVTLSLGILASMFTAIFVSRILFDLWTAQTKTAKLSI